VRLSLSLSVFLVCGGEGERRRGDGGGVAREGACGFAVAARRGLASCGLLEKWRCRVWLLRAAIHPQ
jgi:hypothetical protein